MRDCACEAKYRSKAKPVSDSEEQPVGDAPGESTQRSVFPT